MDAVQILRALADPALPAAAQAALDAVEREPRHLATIAGLEETVRAQAAEIQELRDQLKPAVRTVWGSSMERRGGETYPQVVARLEKTMGPLEVVRHFHAPGVGPKFPTELGTILDTRDLVLSWKRPPAEVKAGKHDAGIHTMCADFAAWRQRTGRQAWISYEHEADSKIRKGQYTVGDYRAGFDRFAGILAQYGDGLYSTAIFTGDVRTEQGFDGFHPERAQVIGWDPYKWDPNTDIEADMYAAPRAIAERIGKPWGIAETGVSVKHTPQQRAAALTSCARSLATIEPRPVFVTYFNSDPDPSGRGSEWRWPIDSDPAMCAAWNAGRAA